MDPGPATAPGHRGRGRSAADGLDRMRRRSVVTGREGSRRRGPGRLASVASGAALVLAGCGGGGAGWRAIPRYAGGNDGAYPSFLPRKTLDPTVEAALIGTEAKRALQAEGLAIEAGDQSVPRRRHRQRADRTGRRAPRPAGRDDLHVDRDDAGAPARTCPYRSRTCIQSTTVGSVFLMG